MILNKQFFFIDAESYIWKETDSKPSMQLACVFTRHLIILQSPLSHNIISCLTANEILWEIGMIEQHNVFKIISYLIRSLLLSAMNGIWLKQQLLSL